MKSKKAKEKKDKGIIMKRVFKSIRINFWGSMSNGFRMTRDWDNIDQAIEELKRIREEIIVMKEKDSWEDD